MVNLEQNTTKYSSQVRGPIDSKVSLISPLKLNLAWTLRPKKDNK